MAIMDMNAKLSNLILYLAERSTDDPTFDRTKLGKLLFFCDFRAYAELGESITDSRYRKLPQGPLADEQPLAERELCERGELEVVESGPAMYRKMLVRAKQDADTSELSGEQIAIIEDVLHRHHADDAARMILLSKAFPGYEAAFDGEEIPYHTVCIPPEGPTQADIDRGLELIREGVLP